MQTATAYLITVARRPSENWQRGAINTVRALFGAAVGRTQSKFGTEGAWGRIEAAWRELWELYVRECDKRWSPWPSCSAWRSSAYKYLREDDRIARIPHPRDTQWHLVTKRLDPGDSPIVHVGYCAANYRVKRVFFLLLYFSLFRSIHCVPKKHVTTFSTITLTISVRLQ